MGVLPLYEAYWSTGAFTLGWGVRSVTRYLEGDAAFSDDAGYDDADRADIAALELGGTWAAGDYGQWHRLRRIAGPSTRTEALNLDSIAEDNGDFEGTGPLYEESRGSGLGLECRIVDPKYFHEGGAYPHEALNVAENLGVGEAWTSADITLKRIR